MHWTVLLAVPSGLAFACFGWAAVAYFSHVRTRTPLKLLLNVTAPVCVLALIWDVHLGRHPLLGALGVCLTTASLALFWGSVVSHGSARPAHALAGIAPTGLVRRGAYRVARHPFYLSYLLAYAGWGLIAETLLCLPVLAWLGLLYWCAARQEERAFLAGPLAGQYRAYCRSTGMFWPKGTSAPAGGLAGPHFAVRKDRYERARDEG
jgi:protein-S-isoprenylcysteine O-methyltransferase Ste14